MNLNDALCKIDSGYQKFKIENKELLKDVASFAVNVSGGFIGGNLGIWVGGVSVGVFYTAMIPAGMIGGAAIGMWAGVSKSKNFSNMVCDKIDSHIADVKSKYENNITKKNKYRP